MLERIPYIEIKVKVSVCIVNREDTYSSSSSFNLISVSVSPFESGEFADFIAAIKEINT